MREFSEQELVRREKCEKLRELGLDPFGQKYDRKDFCKDVKEKYELVDHDDFENMDDTATVAGRIMFIRKMGKASFFTIKDKSGSIHKNSNTKYFKVRFWLSIEKRINN